MTRQVMLKVRNVSFVPFTLREFLILFSDAEILHKNINGVESLSRSESSNLDLCDIFGLISQARSSVYRVNFII